MAYILLILAGDAIVDIAVIGIVILVMRLTGWRFKRGPLKFLNNAADWLEKRFLRCFAVQNGMWGKLVYAINIIVFLNYQAYFSV